jgi:GTPase SAR1 family protein
VEDFHQTELLLRGSRILPLDIVDMSGDYMFPAMTELAIAYADVFVLVFNVGNERSFQHIRSTRDLIFQVKGDPINSADIPIVVVGNMVDRNERCLVDKETTKCVVTTDWNHSYVETSAKTNCNIRTVFDKLLANFKIPGVSTTSWRKKCTNWSHRRPLNNSKDGGSPAAMTGTLKF